MKLQYIVGLLCVLMLAACGGGGETQQEATQPPAATNTPAAQAAAATTTFETEDGGTLRVSLPAGWVADTTDGLTIANSQAALDAEGLTALSEGQVRAVVDVLPKSSELLADLGLRNTSRPQDVVETSFDALTTDTVQYEIATPRTFIISGRQGAFGAGTVNLDGTTMSTSQFILDRREGFIRVLATAPEGEIGRYEGTLRTILGTIDYTPPQES